MLAPLLFPWPRSAPHFLILESPLFDRVNHSKSAFITTENRHAGETIILAPYFFPWPCSGRPSFFILESPLTITVKFLVWENTCKELHPLELTSKVTTEFAYNGTTRRLHKKRYCRIDVISDFICMCGSAHAKFENLYVRLSPCKIWKLFNDNQHERVTVIEHFRIWQVDQISLPLIINATGDSATTLEIMTNKVMQRVPWWTVRWWRVRTIISKPMTMRSVVFWKVETGSERWS